MFDFRSPYFLIRDPEIAKLICIKEFDHFTDHIHTINDDIDPLLGNALLSLSGKKWKDMRATLSPAFTGSKMRHMQSLVNNSTDSAIATFRDQLKDNLENGEQEMKEFFSKFSVDIIASCAFGLEVDTFKVPENDFKKIADRTMNPSGFQVIFKFLFLYLFPKIMKKFDISLLDDHTKSFFRKTVIETMNYREENQIVRPDMIHLLLQTMKGKLVHEKDEKVVTDGFAAVSDIEEATKVALTWSNDELIAQCLIFFLAGFDTTSTTLAFSAYELAVNPDIQETLRKEIESACKSLNGEELTYEVLMKMKFLDQFVSEVLRKWTPSPGIERICVKDFTFEVGEKSITISKDQSILIPAFGWHRDPLYFPNPEKFDPERFNSENIKNQNMNAFAPFGIGPRNCIGSRFALMSVKTVLFKALLNFSFEVSGKTQIPLRFKKSMMQISAENGFWVHVKPLKKV